MKSNNSKKNKTNRLSALKIQSNLLSTNLPASDCSPPTPEVIDREENFLLHSLDVHLTVRSKVQLTGKQACMLAGIAISGILSEGISLKDWIILEFLYSFLLGNKQEPEEATESKEFEILLILKIILLSGTWMGLESRKKLSEELVLLIKTSRLIPKERTIQSWTQHWDLESFLEIRAVPMTTFMKRQEGFQRYSGYCKGYGESSPAGKCKKTKYSSELDGTEPIEKVLNIDLLQVGTILSLVLAEERLKSQRKNHLL